MTKCLDTLQKYSITNDKKHNRNLKDYYLEAAPIRWTLQVAMSKTEF